MHRVQADKLLYPQEEDAREKAGAEKALQMVPEAHGPQRNQEIKFLGSGA
jgi:hypothetical protein